MPVVGELMKTCDDCLSFYKPRNILKRLQELLLLSFMLRH